MHAKPFNPALATLSAAEVAIALFRQQRSGEFHQIPAQISVAGTWDFAVEPRPQFKV